MRTTLLAIFLSLAGWSCRKDVETFRPYDISVTQISQALQQVPAAPTQSVFVLNNRSADTLFVTPSGIRIFLDEPDLMFSNSAGVVVPCSSCPDFRLEVIEIQRKGDFIARNTSTTTPDDQVLQSGGILHLRASCNGVPLQLTPGSLLKIQIPAEQPFFANQLFSSDANQDIFTGWAATNQPVTISEWQTAGSQTFQSGYEMSTPSLDWVCAGRRLEEPSNTHCVELPLGFSNQNTQAYMVFKSIRTLIPLQYQGTDFRFCAPFVPQGLAVQLVTISKLGEQYWLGNKDIETGGTNNTSVQPQKMSEQQVIDFIQNL